MSEIKINRATTAPLLAEFLGTGILALVALVLSETTAVSYFIGTSVALALGVVYLMFSSVSGAHVNPAVTFGMWTARRIGTIRAVCYIVAQVLGGLGAWLLYKYLIHQSVASKTVSWSWRVFVAEALGAAIVTIGFAALASRAFTALESAWTYGTALFVGVIIASTASAGILNPAVAVAERYVNWVYLLGPLAGGLIGANIYTFLFAPMKKAKR
jgi:aquaporin Z